MCQCFGTKFGGGQNLLFTFGGFFNKIDYSSTDWLDRLISSSTSILWDSFDHLQTKCEKVKNVVTFGGSLDVAAVDQHRVGELFPPVALVKTQA